MSRFTTLRSILRHLVLASLPLAAACGCPEPTEATVVLDPDSEKLNELVERCDLQSDCEELCRTVVDMLEGPGTAFNVSFSICELSTLPNETRPVVHYEYAPECIGGRRPDGLCVASAGARNDQVIGAWFARLAHLEAASVHAFVGIARELRAFGAPRGLVQRALKAARDEIRHAWLVGALALRYGAEPIVPAVEPPHPRPLLAFAIENAAEGCVRETFGAMVAAWQARAASDPVVRAAMTRIADDESRHAELSLAIDRWARARLDAAAWNRVEVARRKAVVELAASAASAPAPALMRHAGLPNAEAATRLIANARQTIWAHAA